MDILYSILAAAGALFALSMLFICLGLFKKPKPPKVPEFDEAEYFGGIDVSSDEVSENDGAQEDGDDESEDSDDAEETEEAEAETEEDSEEDEEDSEPQNDESTPEDGISVLVTVIDTNKTHKVVVREEILIGRNPKCDVVVPKPMVSSVHCILTRDRDKVMVEDNNSTNGTLLNGKPLKHVVEVKNNDMLTLGDRQIRVNFD